MEPVSQRSENTISSSKVAEGRTNAMWPTNIIIGMCYCIFLILLETLTIKSQLANEGGYYDAEHELTYAVPRRCDNSSEFCEAAGVKEARGLNYAKRSRVMEAMVKTHFFHIDPAEPDLLSFLRDRYDLPKGLKGPLAEYDFIIVGAGSAGSVLASRLSEDHKTTVLVVEAGRGESLFTSVPILAPFFQQTHYTWPYLMEKQPGICLGMDNQRCFWPRGKAIGGTSVINYMIYTRGLPKDWDQIAADGNYGWSYDDVLPYYMKSERASLRSHRDSPWHGRTGELLVEDVPFRSKLSKIFLDAVKVTGHRIVDYNSPDGFGFNYIQATMSNGRRHSAAKAFLRPHKNRRNLHILPSSTVTKVLIDPITKEAKGVEFSRHRQNYRIYARKEVILSAGPIASPHLLMLSGVGPKKHLQSLGITVLKDSPVGQTLYDHISFPGLTYTLNTTRLTLQEKKVATVDNAVQFMHYGDGPMSSLAGVETVGYIKTNVSDRTDQYPDIEIIGSCASLASDEGNIVAKGIKMADWLYKDVYKPIENTDTFAILFMLLHPKSKGFMKLKSNNPLDHPKLYGNYMTHPHDVATMVAAIRYITKIIDTPPFQKYGARLYTKKFPNCKEIKFDSDKYWECALRTLSVTLHHQIATCKMGPNNDNEAVVDPELRVYGVKRLRVVDSSVIPRTITAHTNAPAIMIGEKAADMIKWSWGLN